MPAELLWPGREASRVPVVLVTERAKGRPMDSASTAATRTSWRVNRPWALVDCQKSGEFRQP